jgi:hypothetical protein
VKGKGRLTNQKGSIFPTRKFPVDKSQKGKGKEGYFYHGLGLHPDGGQAG